MSESQGLDHYAAVLADLKAQRDQIDKAIQAIEALRGIKSAAGDIQGASSVGGVSATVGVDGPGAFLGMTIVDAAKKLLAARRQPLKNPEIAAAFKAGGLHMNSNDPVNTIGSVLTRRSNEVGDLVKVGRGTWGLKEWYPNRSFKKGKATEEIRPNPGGEEDDLSDVLA